MDPATLGSISAILDGASKYVQSIGNIFLGNKKLNNELQVSNWQYNLGMTTIQGNQALDQWKLLAGMTSKDSTTGLSIVGGLVLIAVVFLIVKK
jgi:hypothetical protein